MRMTIAVQGPDGTPTLWEPTTLDQLGKLEADLEAALSRTPELLCLETRRTGIYGPFAVFNQLDLATPQGRTINPDITLLTASGDVVVVEVKRFVNPELRKRDVIAQAIDYVASLTALTEDGLARLFNRGEGADWNELVRDYFPNDPYLDELSDRLRTNAHDGNVHIVIACDKAPHGVYDMARSVSAQSHLGFSLDVIEVTPYVSNSAAGQIMFVPAVRLSTDIVARTSVSVRVDSDSVQPVVTVETTNVQQIEENLASAARGQSRKEQGRIWPDEEIESLFLSSDDPVVRDLFVFAREENYNGRFQSRSRKITPAFNFYVRTRQSNGAEGAGVIAQYVDGTPVLRFFLNFGPDVLPGDVLDEFKARLKGLFGNSANLDMPAPGVPLEVIGDSLEALKDAIRTLNAKLAQRSQAAQDAIS